MIFFGAALPTPVLGDEELPGRDPLEELEARGFETKLGPAPGPVDRMKSAKSRTDSSLVVGSRAMGPGDRGPGDRGTDLGGNLLVSEDKVVGLVLLMGLERRPFRPLSFVNERDVAGRSNSALAGVMFPKESASSTGSRRVESCHLGESRF